MSSCDERIILGARPGDIVAMSQQAECWRWWCHRAGSPCRGQPRLADKEPGEHGLRREASEEGAACGDGGRLLLFYCTLNSWLFFLFVLVLCLKIYEYARISQCFSGMSLYACELLIRNANKASDVLVI